MDKSNIRQAKISDIESLLPQIMIFEEQHAVYEQGKGALKMRLYVAKQNTNAKKLYKKLGFRFHQSIWKEYIKELV